MTDDLTELADPALLLIVLVCLVLITGGVVKAWKPVRKIIRWLDRVIGDENDKDNPGILKRMDHFEAQLAEVHHEVTMNHGGSLKDAVARIEERQKTDHARLNRLEQVAETVEEISAVIDPDD